MTKASDNDFPSLLLTEQGSAPTSPAASHQRLYIRTSDHTLVTVNSSGTVASVGGGGGGFTFSGASVYHSAAQTVSGAVLAFNSEDYDTDSYHDNSTNNSRLTVPTTAKYLIAANIYTGDATARVANLRVNGTDVRGSYFAGSFNLTKTMVLSLTAADYVEVLWVSAVATGSGTALNQNVFSIVKLA